MIAMSFDLTKTLYCCHFGGHCLREVFQILHDYNLHQGLAIHSRFDDLDVISKSQVYQNHKLQIVLDSCPL